MFEFSAGISFIIDSLIILLYFSSPWLFGNSISVSVNELNPLNSVFLFIILSGLRIVAFIPYIWLYHNDRRLVLAQVPYLWHSINFILLFIKSCWELSHQTWNILVWYILLGSAISVCCQTICLRQLISTALPERHVILGITRSIDDNNNNNTTNSANTNNSLLENGSEHSQPPDTNIIQVIKISLQDVRQEWNRKIDKLANTFTELRISSGLGENKSDETIVFEQLLVLFTQSHSQLQSPLSSQSATLSSASSSSSSPEIVISNLTKLYYSYPLIVEFYIPQLLVFLLYGSFDVTSLLQNALFEMCEDSITFAHRLHWFIVAFCLSGAGVGPDGVAVLHHLLKQIETRGIISAQRLLSSESHSENQNQNQNQNQNTNQAMNTNQNQLTPNRSQSSHPSTPQQYYHHHNERYDIGEGEEKIALLHSQYGLNHNHSIISSSTYFKSLLLEKTCPLPNNLNDFTSTIAFWESLCELSLHLGSLPREVRTEQMRVNLHPIQDKFLPSSTIYSPVSGNTPHRIWRIQIEESFAFSTKERAPMLLCLEIVEFTDYQSTNQRQADKTGSNWLEDIRDGIKRAFLPPPHGEDSQTQVQVQDIERGCDENEMLGESSENSFVKFAGSFQQPSTFVSDVGQWSEASPIKLRSRASFDSYYVNKSKRNVNNKPISFAESPRKMVGIPLRSGQSENTATNTVTDPVNKTNTTATISPIPIPIPSTLNQMTTEKKQQPQQSFRNSNVSVDDDPGVGTDKYGNADPIVVFKEQWSVKESRIRATSPIGHLPGYKLVPVIVKSNDDLRQEQCAGQLIYQMHQILKSSGIDCWLKPYTILALSPTSGLLEAIPDTISFDVLRRRMPEYTNLKNFFESFFGEEDTESFDISRSNFIRSLSAYCIVCYLLQIKDRHNGNILLDRFGHIIHIDFGFILGSTPGGNIGFESAPFKLTAEMVELMGGVRSPHFHRFRDLCVKIFMELRKNHHKIVLLLEMLSVGNEHLPFFLGNPQRTIDQLRKRFRPEVHDQAAIEHVQQLINLATDNWTTTCYDRYQRCCVGVL